MNTPKALASDACNAIFLTGYMDEGSPGKRLQELKQGDALTFPDGTSVEVKCHVDRFHLSAHSDRNQLIKFVKQVRPRHLALIHGDPSAIDSLQGKLKPDFPVSCPVNGIVYNYASKERQLCVFPEYL